jgi:uncharacterized membrane protein (GlpM family)
MEFWQASSHYFESKCPASRLIKRHDGFGFSDLSREISVAVVVWFVTTSLDLSRKISLAVVVWFVTTSYIVNLYTLQLSQSEDGVNG